LAERDERFQNLGDGIAAGAHEAGGDLLGSGGRGLSSERVAHGLELIRQLPRPGLPRRPRGGGQSARAALVRREGRYGQQNTVIMLLWEFLTYLTFQNILAGPPVLRRKRMIHHPRADAEACKGRHR
jgi:hypothetical protein